MESLIIFLIIALLVLYLAKRKNKEQDNQCLHLIINRERFTIIEIKT